MLTQEERHLATFDGLIADRQVRPTALLPIWHLAGFALVDRKSRLSAADDVWDMAEFFVLRRQRRAGLGMAAAHRIFSTHPGPWEVRQGNANVAATSFWRAAISAFTGGTYSEELVDDERWRGPVQRFTSGSGTGPAAP